MNHSGDRENPVPLTITTTRPGSSQDDSPTQEWEALANQQEEETLYLRELAGVQDLSTATTLQVVVNTTTSTISHLSSLLSNLQELNLNNSVLESLRDLGTGFSQLQILWVSRCGLKGLEGLSAFPAIRELYASYNDISDLHPTEDCPDLEVLDLEGNCVADADNAFYLQRCSTLQALTLSGNPMADHSSYRTQLCSALTSLRTLDDITVSASDRQANTASTEPCRSQAQPELDFVRQGIKHARVGVDSNEFQEIEMSLLLGDPNDRCLTDARPSTSSIMPVSACTWMRTLRSSQQGSLASLRNTRGALSASQPSSPCSTSPMGSRPESAHDLQRALSSGGIQRPTSAGSSADGLDRRPASASRLGSGSRPFSSRPGTTSANGTRLGTAASAGSVPSASGLYWAKNSLLAGEGTDSASPGVTPKAASGVGSFTESGADEAQGSSALTHGTGATFGANLARDLRRYKGGRPPHHTSISVTRPPKSADAASPSHAAGSRGHGNGTLKPVQNGTADHMDLFEALRRYKMDTADKALTDTDEGVAGSMWISHDGEGGSADILSLGSTEPRDSPEPVEEPWQGGSHPQQSEEPQHGNQNGRVRSKKSMLGKVIRDMEKLGAMGMGAGLSQSQQNASFMGHSTLRTTGFGQASRRSADVEVNALKSRQNSLAGGAESPGVHTPSPGACHRVSVPGEVDLWSLNPKPVVRHGEDESGK